MGTRKAKFLREPGDAARARRRAGRRCWRPGAASEACASPHVSMPACMRRRVRIPRREPALPPPGACARARGRRACAANSLLEARRRASAPELACIMASEGEHVDESVERGEQEPAHEPHRTFEESASAVNLWCLSMLHVQAGDAAVVGQDACTPEDIKMCPSEGPGNNEYLLLSPERTIFSELARHGDFEALEKKRLQRDKGRAKRLDPATMKMRMCPGHVLDADCSMLLKQIKEGLQKRNRAMHFCRNASDHLCGCSVKGVVHGLGIVDAASAEDLLFLRACGRRVDGDAGKEAARAEWKKILADLRGAPPSSPGCIMRMVASLTNCSLTLRAVSRSESLQSSSVKVSTAASLVASGSACPPWSTPASVLAFLRPRQLFTPLLMLITPLSLTALSKRTAR